MVLIENNVVEDMDRKQCCSRYDRKQHCSRYRWIENNNIQLQGVDRHIFKNKLLKYFLDQGEQ